MGRYRWTGSGTFRDHANDREVDPGEVVDLSDQIASAWSEFEEVDEPADADEDAEGEPTCVGNDGECSRPVDEEGGRCWQHRDDD